MSDDGRNAVSSTGAAGQADEQQDLSYADDQIHHNGSRPPNISRKITACVACRKLKVTLFSRSRLAVALLFAGRGRCVLIRVALWPLDKMSYARLWLSSLHALPQKDHLLRCQPIPADSLAR